MTEGGVRAAPATGWTAAVDRAVAHWAAVVMRAPRLALAVLGILCLLAAGASTRLSVDTDSSRMLSPDLTFQARAQAINEAFPSIKNTILVVVRSANGDAADGATVAIADALAARQETIGRVFAPAADPFLIAHGLLYDDLDTLESRLSRLSQSANLLAELRADQSFRGFLTAVARATELAEGAEFDPEALARLHGEAAAVMRSVREGAARPFDWSAVMGEAPEEGLTTRVVTVEPLLDFTRLSPAKPAIEAVRGAVAGLDPALARLVETGITGDPVLRAEELQSVAARIGWSLGLSLLLVAGVLFLTLGRAGRVGIAMTAVLATLVLTTGIAALTVGALNLISVAFVVLMVGLGIDFAIHLMAHIDEEAAAGAEPRHAVWLSAGGIGAALALSAATTAVAFFAFAATDFVGMAQLGLIGGVGVLIAFAVAITLIPAAVALRPGLARGRGPLGVPRIGRGTGRVLFWLALAVAGAAALIAPQARFDADPMGLRNPAAGSVTAYGWLTGDPALAPLRLSVLTDTEEEAAAAAERADAVAEVKSATWLGDLVPADQGAKLDQIDLAYPSIQHAVEGEAIEIEPAEPGALAPRLDALGTPEAAALASEIRAMTDDEAAYTAALFRFFPQLIDRLALQLEVDEIGIPDLPAPLVERFRSEDGRYRVEITPEADVTDPAARAAFVAGVAAALPEAGGPPAQVEGAAEAVGGAMMMAAALALALTAVLSWLVLRRVADVAAILVPLLLAAGVTLAASALMGLPFNYANIIVLPLMIGIGVDSGVHLAMRSGRELAVAAQAGRHVFDTSTPRAVLASALTTIAAFGTLALSEHRGTASMGVMLAIALIASVAMIFALTPRLVRIGRRIG